MTTNEVQKFRQILNDRVAELERNARQRDGITIERSADLVEDVQCASERALAGSNLDRVSSRLREARAALGRIQDGIFGICQQCEDDIHPKRLAAVPWAAYCIHCQETTDRNSEKFEVLEMPVRDLLARAA